MSVAVAEAVGVSHRFGSQWAVDQVALAVAPGEVVGLIGANGAGKTTLIRILLGLLRPALGTVRLFGEPPSRETRRRLGYMPQGLGLYDDLTPVENLRFSASVFGSDCPPLPSSLEPFGSMQVGQLPLGLQRRLAFLEALSHRPDLLVLDEPTSGVDPLARTRLWDQIRSAVDAGAGALVSTHHLDEADECDRLVVMGAGRVLVEGTAAGIVGGARVVEVEAANWAAAFSALTGAGLTAALRGCTLRVVGSREAAILRALGDLPARVSEVPATLEERFFQLAAEQGPSASLAPEVPARAPAPVRPVRPR